MRASNARSRRGNGDGRKKTMLRNVEQTVYNYEMGLMATAARIQEIFYADLNIYVARARSPIFARIVHQ